MAALPTLTLILAAGFAFSQEAPPATYRTQTDLVLVQFHVGRDKYYVSDLKQSDIVLLEDGKPRAFTTFERPADEPRTVELVLLFDTPKFASRGSDWLEPTYSFIPAWDEEKSRAILEKGKANVRASVYHYDGNQMQPLCRSSIEPRDLAGAFRRLLTPIPAGEAIQLTFPPRPESPASPMSWTFPAVIATLQDSTAAADHVTRAFIVFSRGQVYLHPTAADVSTIAANLGISIHSVVLDPNIPVKFRQSLAAQIPLRKLAELTGGTSFDVTSIDAARMLGILESIKNDALSQYIVGFVPPPSSQPRQHKLEVRLVSKSSGKVIGGTRSATY